MKEFIEKLIGRLEEKFKYNSEQAEIWRSGSDKDAYSRGQKDLYMDRANTYGEVMHIVNQLAEEYINCSTDTSTNTSSGWIPCSERLPLFIDNVLVCTKSGGRTVACLTTGKRFCDTYMNIIYNVVAWMPLPPAYVSEEGRG